VISDLENRRNIMKRMLVMTALVLIALPGLAQSRRANDLDFASDFQTLPVAANLPGLNGTFLTYLAIQNPTASAFNVTASFYDANGTKRDATIQLAAGQIKTFQNFLQEVFNTTGGGAVTFSAPETAGGTHNNRFIISSEVRTGGTHFSTTVPLYEFAGSSSRSFAPGITIDANSRTNAGCFNQSDSTNIVTLTALNANGAATGSTTTLTLPPHAWSQTAITPLVTGGAVQFDPTDSAVCYAVVVDNATGDGRFISATEYRP